ncbi:MAG: hypothetical protein K2K50_06690 [Anaeroplasmataceae bacterium]|nr:hypothetical protein [Anaeroplasmataceae bacterium]
MNIKSILAYIKFRPCMFVGPFENLREFIQGFHLCNKLSNKEEPVDKRFVEEFDVWTKEALIKENIFDIERIRQLEKCKTYIQMIQLIEEDEKSRFDKFFKLCDIYFEERSCECHMENKTNFYQYILFLEKNKKNISFNNIRGLIDGFRMNLWFKNSSDMYNEKFKEFYDWIIEYIQQNYQEEKILKQICSTQDYIYHISLSKLYELFHHPKTQCQLY